MLLFLYLLAICLCSHYTLAVPQNVLPSDPLIQYDGEWKDPDPNNCLGCADLDQGPWKFAAYEPNPKLRGGDSQQSEPQSAEFLFNGSAISVYCILSNRVEPDRSRTKFKEQSRYFFTLDGKPETPFTHQPNGSNQFEYHSLVFNKTDLADGFHTLTIRNGEPGGDRSVMRLEQLVYVASTNPPSAPLPPEVPALASPAATMASAPGTTDHADLRRRITIIATVCSLVGALVVFIIIYLLFRQWKLRREPSLPTTSATPSEKNWFGWLPGRSDTPPSPTNSFHPSLFVRATRAYRSSTAPRRSRAGASQPQEHIATAVTEEVRSDLASAPSSRSAPHDSNFDATRTRGRRDPLMAVQEWRRQSGRGDPNAVLYAHPTEMSEVDLSIHYDDSSASGEAPPQPAALPESSAAPTPIRNFTVMNK
ncbi:hypothetical protein HGRIS_014733 [Hohenbuehelia grisea]|uniref:Uncharacterized protein n=1 Tax=Hohenbuehelia grisea TaxID=104357 RepID=A0ABR3IQL3_9AGAR